MKRVLYLLVPLLAFGCGKIFDKLRPHPDAGFVIVTPSVVEAGAPVEEDASADADAGEEEDDEEVDAAAPAVDASGPCPLAIHPGYCRSRCKSFSSRKAIGHAQRVYPSAAHAFGTCDTYDVFAEKQADGGGIVEFYDKSGVLVGARDDRQKGCNTYGTIPKCTPALKWINDPYPSLKK